MIKNRTRVLPFILSGNTFLLWLFVKCWGEIPKKNKIRKYFSAGEYKFARSFSSEEKSEHKQITTLYPLLVRLEKKGLVLAEFCLL